MQKLIITDQTTREQLVAGYAELEAELKKAEELYLKSSEQAENLLTTETEQSAKIVELQSKLADAETEIGEANNTVEDLKQKLAAKGAEVATKKPVITVDKVQYEVTIPQFNFEGKVYKAEDLESDKELCKKLVAIEFGGLREIRDRKKS